jgi:hypothetical protein
MKVGRNINLGLWSNDDRLDLKGFVYRTSRAVGGSITPLSGDKILK